MYVKGPEFYDQMAVYARNYLALQKLRMATDARIRKFRDADQDGEVMRVLINYRKMIWADEKEALKIAHAVLKEHPLWGWCESVKGLGPVAALTLLGFVNPYKANTAGKAKAYLGLIPGAKRVSGEQSKFNPFAKARVLQVAEKVIMQKSPGYYDLYLAKKGYYMTDRGFERYLEDPTLCPMYDECVARLLKAAKREGRDPKKPACRGHVDHMAKRWLAELIVSHALEIMREAEGLETDAFKAHRGYIPPIWNGV